MTTTSTPALPAVAEEIEIAGAGTTAKTRNPIAVAVLAVVTLGIYLVCWWYFINRELADLGRAKGTTECCYAR